MAEDFAKELVNEQGTVDDAAVTQRITELANRAQADAASFVPPEDLPATADAQEYLQTGAGQAIALYIHLRTGGRTYRFASREFRALTESLNTWLGLYAACYGVDVDPDVSIRTAAEVLLATEDIQVVAELLTGVPDK